MLGIVFVCASCGRARAIPELPKEDISRFTPAVAELITGAARAAKENPEDPASVGRYCMTLHAHDQVGLAADCYSLAVRLAPRAFEWQYRLAVAAAVAGRTEESARTLERALTLRPDYVPARLRRAAALLDAGAAGESAEQYRRLTTEHPRLAEAYYGLGRSLAAAGDLAGGTSAMETACELFPQYSKAHYSAAQLYRRTGDLRQAELHLRAYEQSRQREPDTEDVVLAEVWKLNSGAQINIRRSASLEAEGRLDEAAAANLDALRADPSSVQAHVNLISLYARLRRFSDAEQHFHSAVALDPSNADAHYNYGVLLLNAGRPAQAASEFRQALRTNPAYADAHNNYGLTLEMNGDIHDALRHFRQAIRINPTHRGAQYNAGRALILIGKPKEAIAHFRQIMEPEDEGATDVFYGLATAHAKSGDIAEALSYMRKTQQLAIRYERRDLLGRIAHDIQALTALSRR